MKAIFILIVIFQVKHFLCDYMLQTPYMLGKFKEEGWLAPLAAHAGVHAVATFLICAVFLGFKDWDLAYLLALLDFTLHFIMDRLKAAPHYLGRYEALSKKEFANLIHEKLSNGREWPTTIVAKRSNQLFWISLGFDQMVHHLTHYVVIGLLIWGEK